MARTRAEDRAPTPWDVKRRVMARCKNTCAHCGKKLVFSTATIEHVIPLSKGGKNSENNYVVLCETCNKEKSNFIIPPKEYYPYLPEDRKKELTAMFQEFIDSDDYLDMDNLFIVDWFDLKISKPLILKNRKMVFPVTTGQVRRISSQAAFDNLQMFTGRLSWQDKTLMADSPDRLTGSWYELKKNNKTMLTFSPYLVDGETDNGPSIGTWPYILNMDYFFNPEYPLGKNLREPTLFCILTAILEEIQKPLLSGAHGSAILIRLRCPASGIYVDDICTAFATVMGPSVSFYDVETEGKAVPGNRVRYIQFVAFSGSRAELDKFITNRRRTDLPGLTAEDDPIRKKFQEDLIRRLENTDKVSRRQSQKKS